MARSLFTVRARAHAWTRRCSHSHSTVPSGFESQVPSGGIATNEHYLFMIFGSIHAHEQDGAGAWEPLYKKEQPRFPGMWEECKNEYEDTRRTVETARRSRA